MTKKDISKIGRKEARWYVSFGQIEVLMAITLSYYAILKNIFIMDYYLSAIISAGTGGIWGAGVTNTLNSMKNIREVNDKEFFSSASQATLRKWRLFTICSLIVLFSEAIIIAVFNL
jgi:hypothetical protein